MQEDFEDVQNDPEVSKAPLMSGLVVGVVAGAMCWILAGLIVSALS